tara:strand:- start:47562 stop:48593 length:1032 start_codon:yes stop_codon:yes gene_type:complete
MKINKNDLKYAEENNIIDSADNLWDFLSKKEKRKPNILNIISIILILSGLLFLHYYCHTHDNQVFSIIFLIPVFLILFIISKKEIDITYKQISNFFSWIILILTLFRFSEYYLIDNLSLENFNDTIIIQMISFLAGLLFLIRDNYKNPFLIIGLLLFIPFNILYIEKYYNDNIIFLLINFSSLINLIVYFFANKFLKLNDNIGFIIFLIGFNISGLLIHINNNELLNILMTYLFILINFIFYQLNNILLKDRKINIILFFIVFSIAFTFNFFDSINFLTIQILLLIYGIYIRENKIIFLSSFFIIFYVLDVLDFDILTQSVSMIFIGLIMYAIINKEKGKNNA